jgi:hypothetical protein
MFTFTTDYFILVFFATIGVIQIGASVGHLPGLLIFKAPLVARVLGLALAVAAFIWFFSSGTRNINDHQGGIDANAQALLFFLGAVAGVCVTFLTSSLVNLRMDRREPSPEGGLDALRYTSYVGALIRSIRHWRRVWRTRMKAYFFG